MKPERVSELARWNGFACLSRGQKSPSNLSSLASPGLHWQIWKTRGNSDYLPASEFTHSFQ